MSSEQIITLLLGPLGLLVGSLLLNYLQAKGVILSRHVVSVESYKALSDVNSSLVVGVETALKALTTAVSKLPKR